MAKDFIEQGTAKLKLVHLVYGLIAAAVLVGVWIGSLGSQQSTNTNDIKRKVEKPIFEAHEKYQTQQFKSIQKTMDDGFDRIEKSIGKLANK